MTKEQFMALSDAEKKALVEQIRAKHNQGKQTPQRQQSQNAQRRQKRKGPKQQQDGAINRNSINPLQYKLLAKKALKANIEETKKETERRVIDVKKEATEEVVQAGGDAKVTYWGSVIKKRSKVKQLKAEKKVRKKYVKKAIKEEEKIQKIEEQLQLSDEEFLELVKKEKEEFWGFMKKTGFITGTVLTLGTLPLIIAKMKGENDELI
jgi:hypothetical protein